METSINSCWYSAAGLKGDICSANNILAFHASVLFCAVITVLRKNEHLIEVTEIFEKFAAKDVKRKLSTLCN